MRNYHFSWGVILEEGYMMYSKDCEFARFIYRVLEIIKGCNSNETSTIQSTFEFKFGAQTRMNTSHCKQWVELNCVKKWLSISHKAPQKLTILNLRRIRQHVPSCTSEVLLCQQKWQTNTSQWSFANQRTAKMAAPRLSILDYNPPRPAKKLRTWNPGSTDRFKTR